MLSTNFSWYMLIAYQTLYLIILDSSDVDTWNVVAAEDDYSWRVGFKFENDCWGSAIEVHSVESSNQGTSSSMIIFQSFQLAIIIFEACRAYCSSHFLLKFGHAVFAATASPVPEQKQECWGFCVRNDVSGVVFAFIWLWMWNNCDFSKVWLDLVVDLHVLSF